jgi:hypothetical protein
MIPFSLIGMVRKWLMVPRPVVQMTAPSEHL